MTSPSHPFYLRSEGQMSKSVSVCTLHTSRLVMCLFIWTPCRIMGPMRDQNTLLTGLALWTRDGTGSGVLTRDPTRPGQNR